MNKYDSNIITIKLCRKRRLTAEINNLSSTLDCSQSDVNVNSHIDLQSSNSQSGNIIGTLKHNFGLKLR
jgi:hypothetical protein